MVVWSWWTDNERFEAFSDEQTRLLEEAFATAGERAKVILPMERGDYVVKFTRVRGWVQHRVSNARLWRMVERRTKADESNEVSEIPAAQPDQEHISTVSSSSVSIATLPKVSRALNDANPSRLAEDELRVAQVVEAAEAAAELHAETSSGGSYATCGIVVGSASVESSTAARADEGSDTTETPEGDEALTVGDDWQGRAEWFPLVSSTTANKPLCMAASGSGDTVAKGRKCEGGLGGMDTAAAGDTTEEDDDDEFLGGNAPSGVMTHGGELEGETEREVQQLVTHAPASLLAAPGGGEELCGQLRYVLTQSLDSCVAALENLKAQPNAGCADEYRFFYSVLQQRITVLRGWAGNGTGGAAASERDGKAGANDSEEAAVKRARSALR